MPVKHFELNASDGDHLTVGEVIRCLPITDYPPVSYYWQRYVNESWQPLKQEDDDNSDDDNSGTTLTLSMASIYTLRCVANVAIGNTKFTDVSHSITLYVTKSGSCF